MIDLCFDLSGTCYAYEVNISAASAYTINITTGNATVIGTLGYEPNYGQGMSYDFETNTIYLSAFNGGTNTGQLRTMDPATGLTTLITDWGYEQIAPFVIANTGMILCPCWIGEPSNPNPPSGSTNISVTGTTLSWTNGVYTTLVELWFGEEGYLTKVYDGIAINQYSLPSLEYETTYQWRVVCKNDTCSTWGPTWFFTTEQNPYINIVNIYPLDENFWTGTCDSISKTEVSLVNAISNELGWMVFDVSFIYPDWYITNIEFHGYLYANNWPYWSITPMGSVVPVNGTAADIFNQVSTHYAQGTAYSFNQETGTLPNGWMQINLTEGGVNTDLRNALNQGWFAIGIVDWDFSSSYYVEFEGWAESNKPYLRIELDYCYYCPPNGPSQLTAMIIYNPESQVQLNWYDNSNDESNFEIHRKYGLPNDPNQYELVGTVPANTTQYIDTSVLPDSTYTYRVFAVNYFGSMGSRPVTIDVPVPVELISFTAEVNSDVVNLFWQTATEKNNSGFKILRSAQNDNNGWERIGFVEGKGTTTEIQSYSFADRPEPGKYKYRLKQIDFDGSFEYSQEIEAEVKAPNVFSLEQNYPNPFNPSTKIKYTIPEEVKGERQEVILKVYDILGNEVITLVNEEQPAGSYEVEFSSESSFQLVRNLTSGIYFYQLKAGDFIQTKKMILLR